MFAMFCAAALFAAVASAQQPPPAEPWKWTLEQRVAARFDAAARAARVAESKARSASLPSLAPAPGDVLDGRAHPELFFPTEAFDHFMQVAYTFDSAVWRQGLRDRSPDILRTDAEWRELDEIVAPYAASLRRERDLLRSEDRANRLQRREIEAELASLRASSCSLRRDAFRAARARFGKEPFDRFLYSIGLEGFAATYSADHDFDKSREYLLFLEEHCQ